MDSQFEKEAFRRSEETKQVNKNKCSCLYAKYLFIYALAVLFIYKITKPNKPIIDFNATGYEFNQNYIYYTNFSININPLEMFFDYKTCQSNVSFNEVTNFIFFPPGQTFMDQNISLLQNWVQSLSSRKTYFFEARGALVQNNGAFVVNNTFYMCGNLTNYQHVYKMRNGTVQERVPYGLFFSNKYHSGHYYAHWIVDFFTPLLKIPKPIRDSLPVIVSKNILPIVVQLLELINIDKNKIIEFHSIHNYIYVDKIFSIMSPDVANRFYGAPLKETQLFLRKKLNLSNEKPTNYIFQNRHKGEKRYVANWDILFNITKMIYPQYNWINDDVVNYDLYYVSKFFNSIYCLVCPTGSNLANTIFMQPKTITLVIFSSWMDIPAMCQCLSTEVYMVVYHSDGNNHWISNANWLVQYAGFIDALARTVSLLIKLENITNQ